VASTKHEFAIFCPGLTEHTKAGGLIINDKNVINRIAHILRLGVDDTLMLFDEQFHSHVSIESISKKEVAFKVLNMVENMRLKPRIQVVLPLLKKEAFEQAIYNITELGGSEIQLLETEKMQRKWGGDKELDRIKRITIAAAEQSKNFMMPTIHAPTALQKLLAHKEGRYLFCDVDGDPIYKVFDEGSIKKDELITVFVGPEGDFSHEEKQLLNNSGVQFYRLTPTVLRSVQAISLALGYLRCLD
jgi:16S rRNA (uracil1498-N3)-methyltransferase